MKYKKILFAGLAAWMSLSSFAFDLKSPSGRNISSASRFRMIVWS